MHFNFYTGLPDIRLPLLPLMIFPEKKTPSFGDFLRDLGNHENNNCVKSVCVCMCVCVFVCVRVCMSVCVCV